MAFDKFWVLNFVDIEKFASTDFAIAITETYYYKIFTLLMESSAYSSPIFTKKSWPLPSMIFQKSQSPINKKKFTLLWCANDITVYSRNNIIIFFYKSNFLIFFSFQKIPIYPLYNVPPPFWHSFLIINCFISLPL